MKRRLLRLYSTFYERYGPQGWWPARSAFEIAVSAVLTQHSAWPGAARAIANLRSARRLEPGRLSALWPSAIGRRIRPAGTWRLKATNSTRPPGCRGQEALPLPPPPRGLPACL